MKSEIYIQIDMLLGQMRTAKGKLASMQAKANKKIEEIGREYAGESGTLDKKICAMDKEIIDLAKREKQELFDNRDLVELSNGSLILSISNRVKRARGVLKKLEKLSYNDVIEISKSVKWSELEKWDDAKLLSVGTKKIKKELISYEIRKEK